MTRRSILKHTEAELSSIYDSLCDSADRLLEKYNPCEWVDGVCARGRKHEGHLNGCCNSEIVGQESKQGCKNFDPVAMKCETKALYCKVWICFEAHSNLFEKGLKQCEEYDNQMNDIKVMADRYRLLLFRSGKEASIRQSLLRQEV